MSDSESSGRPYANPYLAGAFLGVVLAASMLILGAGLGASGGLARIAAALEAAVAPVHTLTSKYFSTLGAWPLKHYAFFILLGVFLGGLLSALFAGRFGFCLERGRTCSPRLRATLVLVGGFIVGFASRFAKGCTSEHGLSGNATLLTGGLLFTVFVLIGAYATAWMVRRQWHD